MNIYQKSLILLCVFIIIYPLSYSHAANLGDTAWWLKRILRLDETIRNSTIKTQAPKKNRAIILQNNQESLGNLIETWNYIPTTDNTLDYTFSLQKYKLSCEIAAIKIVLSGLWYHKEEDEIIKELPHHNKAMDTELWIWWDPDREFVWLYQWSQAEKTGYWIYEWAIAKYLNEFFTSVDLWKKVKIEAWNNTTRPKDLTDRQHLAHLLSWLDNWHHIILWGDWCTAPDKEDGLVWRDKSLIKKIFPIPGKNTCKNYKWYRYFNWKTMEWKEVKWLAGDHVFVLLGYIWKKDYPSHIIVWDTDTGRHIYPIDEWMRKWWMMQNRSLSISN